MKVANDQINVAAHKLAAQLQEQGFGPHECIAALGVAIAYIGVAADYSEDELRTALKGMTEMSVSLIKPIRNIALAQMMAEASKEKVN